MRLAALLGRWRDRESRDIALALALLLAALVTPVVELPGTAHDTVIVFDISQSMGVEDQQIDGAKVDRLAYARAAARVALRELPCGSHIGWGVFAEYRSLLLLTPIEVCAHYNDLLATLDAIDGRMRWGNASEVTKGVFWALRVAGQAGGHPNLVFLTDGQEAPPLRDADMPLFDDLRPGAVQGWIVGVGGDEPKPIPKTDAEGKRIGWWRADDVVQPQSGRGALRQEHLSSLHEPHLQALARRLGLHYARLGSPQVLADALRDPRLAQHRPVPTRLAWLPALAALALLAWRFRPRAHRHPHPRTQGGTT